MKGYILSLAVLVYFPLFALSNNKEVSGTIKSVYICNKSKNKTELLRLYSSGSYEQLLYTTKEKDKEIVSRNIGQYTIDNDKLNIYQPTIIEFKGKLNYKTYVLNNNLYANAIHAKFYKKKKILFAKSKSKDYYKPYYFCIGSDDIVNNPKINEVVNLKDVTNYLLKNIKSEKEQVIALVKFICHSIDYDYEGLRSNKYANKQNDALGILTSNNRVAVCAGYSNTFKTLADSAGLSAKYVTGYTKQSLNDLNKLGGFHAWNIVTCDNKKYIIDVTWADNKIGIESKWLFVNPEIMIGSHFPSNAEDQLLNQAISENDFINSSCIRPVRENASIKGKKLNAKLYVNDKLKLRFPKNNSIDVTSYSDSYMIEYYSSEPKINEANYNIEDVDGIEEQLIGDSIEFSIPLKQLITGLSIVIDNNYELILIAIKGTKKDLMSYYINSFDNIHALVYVRGIIAAIQLGEVSVINKLLGDKSNLVIGKNKKVILDAETIKTIKKWEGEVSELIILQDIDIKITNGVRTKTINEKLFVEIPNGPKFILKKLEGKYELFTIEK